MADVTLQIGVDEKDLIASDAWVEVIDGEIVPMAPIHLIHHLIAGNLYRALDRYLEEHPIGYLFMDGLICVLERTPEGKIFKSYVPDTAYIRQERLPDDLTRPLEGAPDLVVEVISPGNDADDMLTKTRDCLKHGSEEVWLLYPKLNELHRYRHSEPDKVEVYTGEAVIDCAPLFPELKLVTVELFRVRK